MLMELITDASLHVKTEVISAAYGVGIGRCSVGGPFSDDVDPALGAAEG